MGTGISRLRLAVSDVLIIKPYKAAGVLFTDGKHVLAGYQPGKRVPCITGIGGCREKGEIRIDTALRETVEELYDIKKLPPGLLKKLKSMCVPIETFQNGSYVVFVLNFQDLEKILKTCMEFKVDTSIYKEYPLTLSDLIFNRDILLSSEITHLALLPFVRHEGKTLVSPDFLKDIRKIQSFTVPCKIEV